MSKSLKTKVYLKYFFVVLSLVTVIAFATFFILDSNFHREENQFNGVKLRQSETELALVFIGCSTCDAAQVEAIPKVFDALSIKLEAKATTLNYNYLTIGISNEILVSEGLKHLNRIASFDEVAIGNGMGNTALQIYIWDNYEGTHSAGIPQVLILKRDYEFQILDGSKKIEPHIIKESIIARKLGLEGIIELSKNDQMLDSI